MNQLLLTPTDTLFFRDGRPMEGSLAGHGAAWPLPTVPNAALHAVLHDAQRSSALTGVGHRHDHMLGHERAGKDIRAFGSLTSAGPFPVDGEGRWYFPSPLDLGGESLEPTLSPAVRRGYSSLPKVLSATLMSSVPPSKISNAFTWIPTEDYRTYLSEGSGAPTKAVRDADIFLSEQSIGIAIDPVSNTTGKGDAAGKIYSAHSLRLNHDWRLGVLAQTKEKQPDGSIRDLISQDLYSKGAGHMLLGGQQRVCAVSLKSAAALPLPIGLYRPSDFFKASSGKFLLKWILLTPSIYPYISQGISKRGTERREHPGGWLPTWIEPSSGKVLLQSVDEKERLRRRRLNYNGEGYDSNPNIDAFLVSARVDKPIPVTGWANGDQGLGEFSREGAKSTHLAVPAGSIYYFECATAEAAADLSHALNWHEGPTATTIRNRRSTLLGEKGFGIGVCGTWRYHNDT